MGKTVLADIPGLVVATALEGKTEGPAWSFQALAGRLVEASGTATLTCTARLVHEVQTNREPVGWVTTEASSFFPPDLVSHGVDLSALVVVRVPNGKSVPRAGDILMRSGAFSLVVLDLGAEAEIAMPLLSRLSWLAQRHAAVVLCLTEKPSGSLSLGSLVSLHGEARRTAAEDGSFRWELKAAKDKRQRPAWRTWETCHGPVGVH